MEPVWPLFEEVIRRTAAEIVILERDSKFHPFETVMTDIERAREIFYRHRPDRPAGPIRSFTGPDHVADPDHRALEFRDLRAFQRALVARLTDPDFESSFQVAPIAATERFGLAGSWLQRLVDCDPASIHRLAESWGGFQEENRQEQAEYEQREWAAWAELLDQEGALPS